MRNFFINIALLGMTIFIQSCTKDKINTPILVTSEVIGISNSSATSGGEVINNGGVPIIAQGICWNTSAEPSVLNNNTIDSIGTGPFISFMDQLKPNTTYYVRSFALNSEGIGYGNELSFKTLDILPTLDSNKIIAYWNMDNVIGNVLVDFKDKSPGLIYNCQSNPGKVNKALNFNGSGYVKIKDSNLLDSTPEFSLLVWLNPIEPLTHAIIYSNIQEITPHDGFALYIMRFGDESGNLKALDGNLRFFSQETELFSKAKIKYEEWTHIVITYKNNIGRIYINGQLDSEGYLNTPLANEIDQCIGASYSPNYFYKGLIDELKILNVAMVPADILTIYNTEK